MNSSPNSANTKTILVISQFYFPEQMRINDLTRQWKERGYKVIVVCGTPNYPSGDFYEGYGWFKRNREMVDGVEVIRLKQFPRKKNSLMLSLNYISFVISGWFFKMFTSIDADEVFIYAMSPVIQALPGLWYAKKHKVRSTLYVMDLWPDNVIQITGMKNTHMIRALERIMDYIYKKSDKILTSSRSFKEVIHERGIDRDKIAYWPQYAEDFYQPMDDIDRSFPPGKANTFDIIFTGNIGVAQGLNILPEVAIKLQNSQQPVRFIMVGDGRGKENLIHEINVKKVNDFFLFLDKRPAKEVPTLIAQADACLISLEKSNIFDKTIPAKTQSYLACGKPVLVSADGEVSRIIEESRAGLASAAGDIEGLFRNIVTISTMNEQQLRDMCGAALHYSKMHFDREALLNQIDIHFNSENIPDNDN